MSEDRDRQPDQGLLVWERPEPPARPTPAPLSRDAIVQAAIAIADAEGLASVSLRKVGAALGAGPMRLYGYLSTKEDLLDLMVDAVYGEMAPPPSTPGDWRRSLRAIAHLTRRAALTHPWFADRLGGRPHQGPHALAYLEATLAALSGTGGFADIDAVLQAARAVNAYVIGAVCGEASERLAERDSGLTKPQWQAASADYIHRIIATGRFPSLARVVRDATHPPGDAQFDWGLDCVLDGIAAKLAA